jgi:hypothetical protein
MAVVDWVIPVGCAAGLVFMTHALLRGGMGLHDEPSRHVTFVVEFADDQRPLVENRLTDHRHAAVPLVEHG